MHLPYVIAPVELIIILYKKDWKKTEKKESDITRQEFMDWTNGLWTFQGQSKMIVNLNEGFQNEIKAA